MKIDFTKPLETLDGRPIILKKESIIWPGTYFVRSTDGFQCARRVDSEGYRIVYVGGRYGRRLERFGSEPLIRNRAEIVNEPTCGCPDNVRAAMPVPTIDWAKPIENFAGQPAVYLGDNQCQLSKALYPHKVRCDGEDFSVANDGKKFRWETFGEPNTKPDCFIRNRQQRIVVDWTKPIQTESGAPAFHLGALRGPGGVTRHAVSYELGGCEVCRTYTDEGLYCGAAADDLQRIVNKPDEIVYAVRDLHNASEYAAWKTEDDAVKQLVGLAEAAVAKVAARHKIVRYVNGKLDENWERDRVVYKLEPQS